MFKDIIKTARVTHYTKNAFVFAGIIFSRHFTNINDIRLVLLAFLSFCFAASAVYFFNDLMDKDFDKLHPTKKDRPIASDKISVSQVLVIYSLLSLISLFISFYFINVITSIIIFLYLVSNIFYSWKLKHIVLLDIFIVASGFILRVFAGCFAIGVNVSDWLLLSVLFLSLLLAVSKRRYEYIFNSDKNSPLTRKVILAYDEKLLDQMISLITSGTVLTYSLYTILNNEIEHLVLTIPIILYGVFRYLYIIYKKKGGSHPEKELINDKPILFTVLIWIILVMVLIIKE